MCKAQARFRLKRSAQEQVGALVLTQATWRKSTWSIYNGNCVEGAVLLDRSRLCWLGGQMPFPEALTHAPLVILTGAGASVPLDLDTTVEFRRRFFETRIPQLGLDREPEFLEFATDLLSDAGINDIEIVLARLETNVEWMERLAEDQLFVSKVMKGDNEKLRSFGQWSSRLADAIYDEVIDHYGNVDAVKATALYRGLLEVFRDQLMQNLDTQTLPFFTLNYDIAVEEACRHLGIRLIDGFADGSYTGRRWDARSYTEYQEQSDQLTCVLVKLHGSVRLGRQGDGVLVELPTGLRRDPPPDRHAVLYPSLSPKALDVEPFRTNYRLLRGCLGHAKLLIVIGCSMRDQELNVLIGDCLDENDDLHVVAVGPEADVGKLSATIGCNTSRLGATRGYFRIEDEQKLNSGRGRLFNAICCWLAAAVGNSQGPYQFATNTEM